MKNLEIEYCQVFMAMDVFGDLIFYTEFGLPGFVDHVNCRRVQIGVIEFFVEVFVPDQRFEIQN